ncbi:nuclear transport factor 2 family protein [Nocardia zapadnayensis]|uniref:nuclear transport factor 2 family protein n=1 Tax=Nocardia rhamnosiphila TaxID=426716 RepID=UPI0022462A42|nr:nuclear transport factor 2 family protein [Nocardia zapadnayensis]MCX0271639.1 nuclear transport factor 2 family protein [Nocardia zapadnayensis]
MNPLLADCPDAVRAYLTLTGGEDRTAAVALFGDDAQVTDDGHHYTGSAQIRTWLARVANQYSYTTTPIDVHHDAAGQWSVRCRIEGTFPGGLVDLDYHFRLDGSGRLLRLAITPSAEQFESV